MRQLFTYLLTYKLFSSCIRRHLVSCVCDWVMPALSAVLLIFSFQFGLLFFNISPALRRTIGFNRQYRTSDVAENFGRYLSCMERTSQGKDVKLILTVKIKLDIPKRDHLAVNFRQSVITAQLWPPEVARPGYFVSNVCVFLGKNEHSPTVATVQIAPRICQGQSSHLTHTVPDFIQIGSLSAELLPNAWKPFLACRVFTISAFRAYNESDFNNFWYQNFSHNLTPQDSLVFHLA